MKCEVCGQTNGGHDLAIHRKAQDKELDKSIANHPAGSKLRRKAKDQEK